MPLTNNRVSTSGFFGKRCAAALFSAALAASLFPGAAFADVRSSDIIAGLSVQDRGLAASSCPNIVAEHSIVVDENGTVYFERDADSQVQICVSYKNNDRNRCFGVRRSTEHYYYG